MIFEGETPQLNTNLISASLAQSKHAVGNDEIVLTITGSGLHFTAIHKNVYSKRGEKCNKLLFYHRKASL